MKTPWYSLERMLINVKESRSHADMHFIEEVCMSTVCDLLVMFKMLLLGPKRRYLKKTAQKMSFTWIAVSLMQQSWIAFQTVNKKSKMNSEITGLVCKLQTKVPKTRFLKMKLLGVLTSGNFAGLSKLRSILNPENFRSIYQSLPTL